MGGAALGLAERLPQRIKTKLSQLAARNWGRKAEEKVPPLVEALEANDRLHVGGAPPRIWPLLPRHPALLSSPQGWSRRFYYGHNRYFQTRRTRKEAENFSHCGFIRVPQPIDFTQLLDTHTHREGVSTNSMLAPTPGDALIKILPWGAVTMTMLMLSTDGFITMGEMNHWGRSQKGGLKVPGDHRETVC